MSKKYFLTKHTTADYNRPLQPPAEDCEPRLMTTGPGQSVIVLWAQAPSVMRNTRSSKRGKKASAESSP